MFVPQGTNISYTKERGGGQTFLTHRREVGNNIFASRGGDTHFYIGGGQILHVESDDGYDDDEEMDLSEAIKLSAGARNFRVP